MILHPPIAKALNKLIKGVPPANVEIPDNGAPPWQVELANNVAAASDPMACYHTMISDRPERNAIDAQIFQADRPDIDMRKLPLTDTGNAEMIAALHDETLRFDHRRGHWLIWNGHRWQEDDTGQIMRMAIEAIRKRMELSLEINGDRREKAVKWCLSSESKYKLKAATEIASNLNPLADSGEYWDQDEMLLGVANGVVDIHTGEIRDAYPSDRITLSTAIEYDPEAKAPRWERFLREVFNGNDDLIGFVQRAAGYSLTGDTREQCLFLCWGGGANGKSTMLETLRHVMGDYAANTPFSTFELNRKNQNTNDLAALSTIRLVTAAETNESRRLNEARTKAVTGGDPITARFLFGEFFTYTPKFKVWLAMNHKPTITGTDDGIWRRIRLIPFTVSFKGRADKTLPEKLRDEAPGILAWAVQGALDWQENGLMEPDVVVQATKKYRTESDVIARFLDAETVEHEKARIKAGELYKHYKQWSQETGEKMMTLTSFGKRIEDHGIPKEKSNYVYYLGIGLSSKDFGLLKDDN